MGYLLELGLKMSFSKFRNGASTVTETKNDSKNTNNRIPKYSTMWFNVV